MPKTLSLAIAASSLLLLASCTYGTQHTAMHTDAPASAGQTASTADAAWGNGQPPADAMKREDGNSDVVKVTAGAQADGAGQGQTGVVVQARGTYTAYSPSVLQNGKTKVLFFHATWCPICKEADKKLRDWYDNQGGFAMSVYQTDYDTEKALKAKYGVTFQHTFVKVDGQGNLLEKLEGPTDDQLKQLLSA